MDSLEFYDHFEIDDFTGTALTSDEVIERQCERIQALQVEAYANFQPELKGFALSNIGGVESKLSLQLNLSVLTIEKLQYLCYRVGLIKKEELEEKRNNNKTANFYIDLLIHSFAKKPSQLQTINEIPLYLTEELMWNDNIAPTEGYSGLHCLALPKLELQFLSIHDYLWRNMILYRLEASNQIRSDIEDSVTRIMPRKARSTNRTEFEGWARMASPISTFAIISVSAPKLGEVPPRSVIADIQIDLSRLPDTIADEWNELKPHDVLFLLSLKPSTLMGQKPDHTLPFL